MVIRLFDKVSMAISLFAFEIYVLCVAEHVYTPSCDPPVVSSLRPSVSYMSLAPTVSSLYICTATIRRNYRSPLHAFCPSPSVCFLHVGMFA